MKKIVHRAYELGFCGVGFTSADPVNELAHLEEAIASHRTSSMNWLARKPDSRCDPKSLLPEAKSVICLAYPYGEKGIQELSTRLSKNGYNVIPAKAGIQPSPNDWIPASAGMTPPLENSAARYARGEEYHDFIKEKLRKLWESIKADFPNAEAKLTVDTSPVLEKALAMRAGVGWIGKHTILLNEGRGSWFLLGLIITDIEFEADEPAKDLCGSCTKCIDACPTGALKGARKLDSNLCISFHTTQSKTDIPDKVKTQIQEGQYGCDICQEACPYNKT